MKLITFLIFMGISTNVFAAENIVNVMHSENPKASGWSEYFYSENRSSLSYLLTEYYYSEKLTSWAGESLGLPNSWGSIECLAFKEKQDLNSFIRDLKILKNKIESSAVQLTFTIDSTCK